MNVKKPDLIKSKDPDLRFAMAVAITDENSGSILLGRRNGQKKEYPYAWSLPSMRISEAEYADLQDDKFPEKLANRFYAQNFTEAPSNCQILSTVRGERIRRDYHLYMTVKLVQCTGDVRLADKYAEFCWQPVENLLSVTEGYVGTCISLLLSKLIGEGHLDSAVNFLEIAPELWEERHRLDTWTDATLWNRASGDYRLLKASRNGSPGNYIRELTLERYWNDFLSNIPRNAKLLDIGAGDGEFVERANAKGIQALGADLPTNLEKSEIVEFNDVANLNRRFDGSSFDVVTLNLVVQWICELDVLCQSIRKILNSDGMVCITFTPIEYAKPGRFVRPKSSAEPWGWCSQEGISSTPRLVMINRSVGPVRLYPRTANDYIQAFYAAGLACVDARYIFLGTCMDEDEMSAVLEEHPDLSRHKSIPIYQVLKFQVI